MHILLTFYQLQNWNDFYNCCDKKALCHSLLVQISTVSLTIFGILNSVKWDKCLQREFMKVAIKGKNVQVMTKLSTYQKTSTIVGPVTSSPHDDLNLRLLHCHFYTVYSSIFVCKHTSYRFFSLLLWLFICPILFHSSPYFITMYLNSLTCLYV